MASEFCPLFSVETSLLRAWVLALKHLRGSSQVSWQPLWFFFGCFDLVRSMLGSFIICRTETCHMQKRLPLSRAGLFRGFHNQFSITIRDLNLAIFVMLQLFTVCFCPFVRAPILRWYHSYWAWPVVLRWMCLHIQFAGRCQHLILLSCCHFQRSGK